MKNLKTFEEINISEQKVGDYVICEDEYPSYLSVFDADKYYDFIKNAIGLIIDAGISSLSKTYFTILYSNIPEDIKPLFNNNVRIMYKNEIKYWSKNIEDLEAILQTKKYNL